MPNPNAIVRLTGAGFDLSLPLGEEVPKPADGGAKFDEVDRPEDVALTDYTGDSLTKIDVPVLLDGWLANVDQRPTLNMILSLTRGGPAGRPPDFIASGAIPYSGLRCVMEPPDWGDTMRFTDGRLARQELTLHLLEFVDPDVIAVVRKDGPAGGAGAKGAKKGTVTTKEGETLLQVATRVYGNPSLAKEIGQLNGIRDVRKKLKAGIVLKLPITASIGAAGAGKKKDPPKKKKK